MVGLLVAIALGFAVIEYRDSALARRNAELMAERNRLADTCLHAVDNFFFERGRGLVYLLGSGPISDTRHAALEERRHVVDALVEQTLALVTENGQEKAVELRKKWDEVRELRPFLDHAQVQATAIQPVFEGVPAGLEGGSSLREGDLVHEDQLAAAFQLHGGLAVVRGVCRESVPAAALAGPERAEVDIGALQRRTLPDMLEGRHAGIADAQADRIAGCASRLQQQQAEPAEALKDAPAKSARAA